jgi:hypothetical protein
MIYRREFLKFASVAAALALPTALHPLPATAASAPDAPRAPRALVDWHSHFVSQAEMRYFASRKQAPRIVTAANGATQLENVTTVSFAGGISDFAPSDITARIAHLEANGIQRRLLTHTVALGLDATVPLEDLRPRAADTNFDIPAQIEYISRARIAVSSRETEHERHARRPRSPSVSSCHGAVRHRRFRRRG